jgi:hypothetical protein
MTTERAGREVSAGVRRLVIKDGWPIDPAHAQSMAAHEIYVFDFS